MPFPGSVVVVVEDVVVEVVVVVAGVISNDVPGAFVRPKKSKLDPTLVSQLTSTIPDACAIKVTVAKQES